MFLKKEEDVFKITFSRVGYEKKPDGRALRGAEYEELLLGYDEVVEKILNGHTYAYNYDCKMGRYPSSKAFRGTQAVWMDMDDVCVGVDEFVAQIARKPSLVYTTFSDNKRRYRALYLLNEVIVSEEVRSGIYENIMREYEEAFGGEFLRGVDRKSKTLYQLMFGTCRELGNFYAVDSGMVYGLEDFGVVVRGAGSEEQRAEMAMAESGVCDFWAEWGNGKVTNRDILLKYCEEYKYLTNNKFRYKSERGIVRLDENYVEIARRYDGYRHLAKVPVGERDATLYVTALKFLKIWEGEMSEEHLCYCLLKEVVQFYENEDREMTRAVIRRKARQAIRCWREERVSLRKNEKRYAIDRQTLPEGQTWQKAVAEEIRGGKVAEALAVYDASKSIRKNVEMMNAIPLSFRVTKSWLGGVLNSI